LIRDSWECNSAILDFGLSDFVFRVSTLRQAPSQNSIKEVVVCLHGRQMLLLDGGSIMATGTVKWFDSTKGFGFIQPDDGGTDAFVHISAVERAGMRNIVEGQKISYELVRDKKSGKMSADQLAAV
jgi:CspA family cold shock protein